ncbi:MAG: substrate-binding domain-containing protein [Pyrinomonadaceae bacterium]
MSSPFPKSAVLCGLLLCLFAGCSQKPGTAVTPQLTQSTAAQPPPGPPGVLRVCADPNNLPFSNNRGEGFENRIADILAQELGKKIEYTWWAQRRGFFRNTLKADACDLVVGVPAAFEMALTTAPYYRSTYVFVSRKDRGLHIKSFDDPALRNLRIGVQLIGDDFSNSPPAHALTKRNIINNVKGYTVYGDYSQPNPPARIMDAVARRDVDVAIVWGPLAGYFAKREGVPLDIVPVSPAVDRPFLPFVYDISMGVRRGDQSLKERLEQILMKRRSDIDHVLSDYGVPRVDEDQNGVLRKAAI